MKEAHLPLLLATSNPGKAQELLSLLAGLEEIQLYLPQDLSLELEVHETGQTYAENAALKASAYAQASGMAALADDSGLEVDALDGGPGLFSARYASKKGATDADRRSLMLSELQDKPAPWIARFRSAVCVAKLDGSLHCVEGHCDGEIIPQERGANGFGYDPIFLVAGTDKTMAELSLAEKNKLSHRAHAILEIKARLPGLLAGSER